MKRLVSLLTALLMLVAIFAVPVSAQRNTGVYLEVTPDKESYSRGDVVTVIVDLELHTPSDTFGAAFTYDSDVFTLDTSASNTCWLLSGGLGSVDTSKNLAAYAILGDSADNTGDLLKLTFKVKDDATFGDTSISIEFTVKAGDTELLKETKTADFTIACTDHDFKNIVEDEHIIDPATCYSYATYAKSCSICGVESDSETFEGTEYADHVYGAWEKLDDDQHIRYCDNYTVCDSSETADHIWDNGEETTPPTCCDEGETTYTCTVDGCDAFYTEPIDATGEHTYGDWYMVDEDTHRRDCSGSTCEEFEEKEHTWDAGVETTPPTCCDEGEKTYTCTATGCGAFYTEPVPATGNHTYGDWYMVDDNTHRRDCTGSTCEEFEDGDHTWDNECDEECNDCGHTRTVEHDYSDEWTSDAKQHWHACTICGDKTDEADHEYENGACIECERKKPANNQAASGYIYVDETYHMFFIGNGVITTEHVLDENGDCILCKTHIKDNEIIVEVEEPVESTTEEEEDVTVEVEEPAEEENPKTGLALAVVPTVLAVAVAVASKRR